MATALIISPDESHCVLCCEDIEYTACGVCDHPICLKCCVKLRLLRKEYDCPVCRAQLKEVIVSKGYKLWADKTRPRRQLHARNYGILHETAESQEKVDELLQHKCPQCEETYRSFPQVKDHVRRVHSMIYCDICLRNLKIFTHERKCYTREELVRHRKFGDVDDRSHRGHPLCQFCDERYLDNDELLVHLRKNHFWCHLCEKDGSQDYYPQYNELRKHFKEAHFLCEEGECLYKKFTSVFRIKVDFQAHIAQNHSDKLSKAEARQMRQLDINITFAPREESSNIVSGRDFSFPEQGQERYRLNGMASDSRYIGARGHGGYNRDGNSRARDQDTQRRFPQDRTVKVENRGINLGVKDKGDQGEVRRGNMRTSRDVLEGDHKRPPGDQIQEVDKRIVEGGGRSRNIKVDKSDMVSKKGSTDERLGSGSRKEKQQSLDQLVDGNFISRGKKTGENSSQKGNNGNGESSLVQKVEEGKNHKIGSRKPKPESKIQKEQNEKQEKDSRNQKEGKEKKKTEKKSQEVENEKQKTESTSQKEQNEKQKKDSENQKRDKQKTDRKSQKADNEKQKTDSKSQKAESENQKIEGKNTEENSQKPKDLSVLPSGNIPETKENNVKPRATYDSEFPTLSNESSKPKFGPPPGLSIPPGFDLIKTKSRKDNSPEDNSDRKQNPELIGNSYDAVTTTSKQPQKEIHNTEKSLANQSTGKSKTNVPYTPFCKPTYESEFPTLSSLVNGHKSSANVKVPPGLAPPGLQSTAPVRPPPGIGWSVPLKREGSPVKETRNQKLIRDVRRILNLRGESFESFQQVSGSYRKGKTSAEVYYQQCCKLLGKEHIHKVFQELIDILPDEDKKRQLLLVYNDAKVKDKLGDSVGEGNDVSFSTGSKIVEVAKIQSSLEEDFPALTAARTVKNSSSKSGTSVWSQGK